METWLLILLSILSIGIITFAIVVPVVLIRKHKEKKKVTKKVKREVKKVHKKLPPSPPPPSPPPLGPFTKKEKRLNFLIDFFGSEYKNKWKKSLPKSELEKIALCVVKLERIPGLLWNDIIQRCGFIDTMGNPVENPGKCTHGDSTDCSFYTAPICDPKTNKCRSCQTDRECFLGWGGQNGAIYCTKGYCSQCRDDKDCKSPTKCFVFDEIRSCGECHTDEDCSNHGSCVHNNCECKTPWTGPFCSIRQTKK
jgi:hypothetical protein